MELIDVKRRRRKLGYEMVLCLQCRMKIEPAKQVCFVALDDGTVRFDKVDVCPRCGREVKKLAVVEGS